MLRLASIVLVASAALTTPVTAFDAGGFAMQQHQHQLLRQQTAPNTTTEEPPEAGRDDLKARVQALQAQHMKRLRPEYERRVQREGRKAADRWLRQEAYRLGQETARIVQSQ